MWPQIRQTSGDPSAVDPPVPIPNTEVKRCSPDDSVSIGYAKVGRRQSYAPFLVKAGNGALVFCTDLEVATLLIASAESFLVRKGRRPVSIPAWASGPGLDAGQPRTESPTHPEPERSFRWTKSNFFWQLH